MIIFFISGKQGSGKTSLSRALDSALVSRQVYRLRFAGPLYEMHDAVRGVLSRYGIPYDIEKKDGDLLQLLGTEWGRKKFGYDVWVNALLEAIRRVPKQDVVVIEDGRFENEFDSFSNIRCCVRIRLECSREIRKQRAEFWREREDHVSETGLDHYASMGRFDMVLDSDRFTTAELCSQVLSFVNLHRHELEPNEQLEEGQP